MKENLIAVQAQSINGARAAGDGTVILTYQIGYPVFRGMHYGRALSLLNRRYRAAALQARGEALRALYPQALRQYRFDKEKGYPVSPYEANDVFCMTYSQRCILSLYFDRYRYTGGAHGSTVRTADTWDLQRMRRLTLRDFIHVRDWRAYVLREITARAAQTPEQYFPDYPALIAETFNPRNFYAAPDGLVLYFQQYEIAPYAAGLPQFMLPYSEAVRNPQNRCFPAP